VRIETDGQGARATNLFAFTLIELLVVIAIIGILAALVFPVVGVVNKNKQLTLAKAQLQQIQQAIEGYHTKLGFYPPDSTITNNVVTNQLYFELMGTTNDGTATIAAQNYVTIDGSAQATTAQLNQFFGITGLANSSTRAHSDDTGSAASGFLTHLLPNQVGKVDPSSPATSQILILVCPVGWPSTLSPVLQNNPTLNPWRYTSSHPTNNVGSYDLWVDLVIRGKTNRVCNWSANPIQL
jgi:prepilin-type N-terminal cleavage/methylation domain-containing protein